MSGGSSNWTPTLGSWPIRRAYGDHVPSTHPVFPRSLTLRTTPETSEAAEGSWWLFDERVITGSLGATRFPLQPHPLMQILVLDSPPRFTGQWNMQRHSQEDDSRLTREEQKKALGKLKKEIYNPTLKNLSKRLCLYYRDRARNNYNEKANEIDDDGKRCAICLDDFEAREEVTVTPCNHMFHEDCIVPWVKSHGQCPVCRLTV